MERTVLRLASVGVARGLGVPDPTDSVEMGILADLETAKDDVGLNQWLTRQQRWARVRKLDGLRVAAAELCDSCSKNLIIARRSWIGRITRQSCLKLKLRWREWSGWRPVSHMCAASRPFVSTCGTKTVLA